MSAFLDTSVLIRYLVRDDPGRAEQATSLIDSEAALFVSGIVLHETAHVLRSVYQAPRVEVVDALLALLRRRNILTVDMDKDLVRQGLLLCRPSGRVSFADALLWAMARSHGPAVIYSFDRRFPSAGIDLRHDWPKPGRP